MIEKEDMSETDRNAYFIKPETLADKLERGRIKVLDGSWYLPAMGRDAKAEFSTARVPGAQYFDIDVIADTSTNLPHMLPAPEFFSDALGALGISHEDDIVVYDGPGLFSSARVWWTLRVMGASRVRILEGGFDRWKDAGLPVETGPANKPTKARFDARLDDSKVKGFDSMLANIKRGRTLVLDARPHARFTGEAPEPRAGLSSGHIPGSRSLPATDVIRDGKLIPNEALEEKFRQLGIDRHEHVTTSCGSGVTAAILSLALETTGRRGHSLYDGSWAEWGSRREAPVARWKENG